MTTGLLGCSSDASHDSGAGGKLGSGGFFTSGGTPSGGKPSSAGGNGPGGGSPSAGGRSGVAGQSASGGSQATGGVATGSGGATGGAQASGGQPAAGGMTAKGGAAGQSSVAGGAPAGGAAGCAGSACSSEAPSCAPGGPGLDDCGPNGDESCCTSLPVTGGMYYRTYTSSGSGTATGTADPATISNFRLDKYEMTVGRFRQYVNYLVNGGSPPAAGSGKHTHLNGGQGLADSAHVGSFEPGWDASWNTNIPSGTGAAAKWNDNLNCSSYATWSATAGSNEGLPLTCMNWFEAHAFCIWDGGFLPSEAEWKYAAAGGDEQRMYPWGSTDPGTDSQYAIFDCYYPNKTKGNCTSIANVPKVGSTPLGIGRFGQYDLSGSVWEWDLDNFANYVSPCTDCAYLSGTGDRVLPGGGFHTPLMPDLLSSNRQSVSYATTYRGDYGVGVRCARTP
jgi:formylglycine-generating enzyme required for sulfatase activity